MKIILVSFLLFLGSPWFQLSLGAVPPDPDEPPVVGRPEDFSDLVGYYQISAEALPRQLCVEDPLILTVRIQGDGPGAFQPRRGKLRVFPPRMVDDFYIEPLPKNDRFREADKTWEFVYQLRPKRQDVQRVPGLKLVYYSPARRRFQSTYSAAIPLVVKPRPVAQAPAEAVNFVHPPKQFYELATGPKVLNRESSADKPSLISLILALLPPGLCVMWYTRWRRHHPAPGRKKSQRQSRTALLALNALHQEMTTNADQTFAVVTHYLRNRLDLPAAELTGLEVIRPLTRLGASPKTRHLVADFFRACDAARFAPESQVVHPIPPGPNSRESLNSAAVALIQTLEADPCFHRV